MCEANAYIVRKDGKEELLLGDLNILKPEGNEFFLKDIFG
ncbi:MAG: CooT family nickel-binding protein, partial [Planctomycetota bacterium]|nr:CooT family nickel-binding protein [Planctomycetota bacterium]